mgnify:CR=1 FL=1
MSTKQDEARALYNGMIDKRPAMIARCVDEADVAIVSIGTGNETPSQSQSGTVSS